MPRGRSRALKVVSVGRFDDSEGLRQLAFDNGNTVQDVLTKAGITLQDNEEVRDINNNVLDLDKKVRNGMSLVVTGNYKSGN